MNITTHGLWDTPVVLGHPFPGVEEVRMLQAILETALREAAHHGSYQASFHGFQIGAWRAAGLSRAVIRIRVACDRDWQEFDCAPAMVLPSVFLVRLCPSGHAKNGAVYEEQILCTPVI